MPSKILSQSFRSAANSNSTWYNRFCNFYKSMVMVINKMIWSLMTSTNESIELLTVIRVQLRQFVILSFREGPCIFCPSSTVNLLLPNPSFWRNFSNFTLLATLKMEEKDWVKIIFEMWNFQNSWCSTGIFVSIESAVLTETTVEQVGTIEARSYVKSNMVVRILPVNQNHFSLMTGVVEEAMHEDSLHLRACWNGLRFKKRQSTQN